MKKLLILLTTGLAGFQTQASVEFVCTDGGKKIYAEVSQDIISNTGALTIYEELDGDIKLKSNFKLNSKSFPTRCGHIFESSGIDILGNKFSYYADDKAPDCGSQIHESASLSLLGYEKCETTKN